MAHILIKTDFLANLSSSVVSSSIVATWSRGGQSSEEGELLSGEGLGHEEAGGDGGAPGPEEGEAGGDVKSDGPGGGGGQPWPDEGLRGGGWQGGDH